MPRTMLQVRIEALGQHLNQARDWPNWKRRLVLTDFNVDDQLWRFAVEKIHTEASTLMGRLTTLVKDLDGGGKTPSDGWTEYAAVQASSEQVFRECVDLLGGLALRDRIPDERVCRIADAYIKELARDTNRRQSFSIPGLRVELSSTLRRVVTMQFPEWTLWTLPLVAHEYAHVVIEESDLRDFANLVTQQRVRDARGDDDRARESEPRRVRIALADALATVLGGPAYASSALLLRLNPQRQEGGLISDQERATQILAVLGAMNEVRGMRPPPLGAIPDFLKTYWQDSVAIALDGTPPPDQPPVVDPAKVLEALTDRIPGSSGAVYNGTNSNRAKSWSDAWQEQYAQGSPMTAPEPGADEHIREALNAAWHARKSLTSDLGPEEAEEAQERVKALEDVGLTLSELIITGSGPPSGGGTPIGPAPRPSGGPF